LLTNGAPVTGNFISDVRQPDGTRVRNYTGELAAVFAQMAKLGVSGCGFEQPLHAMKRALSHPSNAGFLRPEAALGVVFITDEDDCTFKDPALLSTTNSALGSLTSFRCTRVGVRCATGGQTLEEMNQAGPKSGCVAAPESQYLDEIRPYRDFLDPKWIAVGGIIGDPHPFAVEMRSINGVDQTVLAHSCTYQSPTGVEVADPGIRLKTLFDEFPDRSAFSTICTQNLALGLADLGKLVSRAIGTPCVSMPLFDVDPRKPGLQVDCDVEEAIGANGATAIPKCLADETPPCWRLDIDAATCPDVQNIKLVIVRADAADPATVTNMTCRVQ
jgi:hypothetical protein